MRSACNRDRLTGTGKKKPKINDRRSISKQKRVSLLSRKTSTNSPTKKRCSFPSARTIGYLLDTRKCEFIIAICKHESMDIKQISQ